MQHLHHTFNSLPSLHEHRLAYAAPPVEVLPKNMRENPEALRAYLTLEDIAAEIDPKTAAHEEERQRRLEQALSYLKNDTEELGDRFVVGTTTVDLLARQQEALEEKIRDEADASLRILFERTKDHIAARQAEVQDLVDDLRKRIDDAKDRPESIAIPGGTMGHVLAQVGGDAKKETVKETSGRWADAIAEKIPGVRGLPKETKRNLMLGISLGMIVVGAALWLHGRKSLEKGRTARATGGILAGIGAGLLAFSGIDEIREWLGNAKKVKEMVEEGKEKVREVKGKVAKGADDMKHMLDDLLADRDEGKENSLKDSAIDQARIELEKLKKKGMFLMYRVQAEEAGIMDSDEYMKGAILMLGRPDVLKTSVSDLVEFARGEGKDKSPVETHNEAERRGLFFCALICQYHSDVLGDDVLDLNFEALVNNHTKAARVVARLHDLMQGRNIMDIDAGELASMITGDIDSATEFFESESQFIPQLLEKYPTLESKKAQFIQFCIARDEGLDFTIDRLPDFYNGMSHEEQKKKYPFFDPLFIDVLATIRADVQSSKQYLQRYAHEHKSGDGVASKDLIGEYVEKHLTVIDALQVYSYLQMAKRSDGTLPLNIKEISASSAFLLHMKVMQMIARRNRKSGVQFRTFLFKEGVAEAVTGVSTIEIPEGTRRIMLELTGDLTGFSLSFVCKKVVDLARSGLWTLEEVTGIPDERLAAYIGISTSGIGIRYARHAWTGYWLRWIRDTKGTENIAKLASRWKITSEGAEKLIEVAGDLRTSWTDPTLWRKWVTRTVSNTDVTNAVEKLNAVAKNYAVSETTKGVIHTAEAVDEIIPPPVQRTAPKGSAPTPPPRPGSKIPAPPQTRGVGPQAFDGTGARQLDAVSDAVPETGPQLRIVNEVGDVIYPNTAGRVVDVVLDVADNFDDAARIVGHLDGKPVYLAELVDAARGNDDAMRALSHLDDAKIMTVVADEAGDAAKAVSKLGIIGKAARVLSGVAIAGDVFAIAFAGYEAYHTSQLIAATPEGKLRDEYAERYYYHGAEAAVGGVGFVAGVVGIAAAGTTAGAIAVPVALATLPVSMTIGALYQRHKFHEDLARGVEDWKREADPYQNLANMRTLGFGEAIGQQTDIALKDGNWIFYSLNTGMPLLDAVFVRAKNKIILWKTQGTRERQQEEINVQYHNMIQAIVEESNVMQVPLTVRDPETREERTLTPNEEKYYEGCREAYEKAKAEYLWENGQTILFHGGANQAALGFLLKDAEAYARLQQDRYALEHIHMIIFDTSKIPAVHMEFPDASLSTKEQAYEYQVMTDKQALAGMLAIAQAAIAEGNEHAGKQLITMRIAPILEQRVAPHMLAFRTKVEETDFTEWHEVHRLWVDGNRSKLTELHVLNLVQDILDREAGKVAASILNTARSAGRVSGEDMIEGLWSNLATADMMLSSYLQNPKARWQELKDDKERFMLVQKHLKMHLEIEEARMHIEPLRQKVAEYSVPQQSQFSYTNAHRLQRRKKEELERYERILTENPEWLKRNPL